MTTSTQNVDTPVPQVSVIIPAYNAAAYIAATVESIFAQTFSDFEVIVVNDGSPDTPALETALQPYSRRIRYFRQQNRGPSAARNLGVREARGEYVALLDSDDLWLPHHLLQSIQSLQQRPELCLVYANAIHLKGDQPVGVAFDSVPQIGEPTLDALLAERCTINTSSVVVQKSALLQAGLFDESMNRCEDFDLWLRVAGIGRISYDREIHVCHRLGDGLSADRILMKQGRARAYETMAAQPELNSVQREIVGNKLRDLELEVNTEQAKQSLLAGEYQEALAAATKANSQASSGKLRLAMFGLRYFPGVLRGMYAIYLRILESRKLSQREKAAPDFRVCGQAVNFEALLGHRQQG